jgi:molybdopterin converting factor small subunit
MENKKIEIKLELFGAFLNYSQDKYIIFTYDNPITVEKLKKDLKEKIQNSALVDDSVLANEDQILNQNELISKSGHYAILPPVCGG